MESADIDPLLPDPTVCRSWRRWRLPPGPSPAGYAVTVSNSVLSKQVASLNRQGYVEVKKGYVGDRPGRGCLSPSPATCAARPCRGPATDPDPSGRTARARARDGSKPGWSTVYAACASHWAGPCLDRETGTVLSAHLTAGTDHIGIQILTEPEDDPCRVIVPWLVSCDEHVGRRRRESRNSIVMGNAVRCQPCLSVG